MFSDDLKARLKTGKYTQWAIDLSEENLEALLWMIGEYACRACEVFPILEEHERRLPEFDVVITRALTGLKGIEAIYFGERFDVDEATKRIRDAVEKAQNHHLK